MNMNEFNEWIADFRQQLADIKQQQQKNKQQIDALKRANDINYPLRRNDAICYVQTTSRLLKDHINREKDMNEQFNELLTNHQVQDDPILIDRVKNCINLINVYDLYDKKSDKKV